MSSLNSQIYELIDQYGTDVKQALQENSKLEYLYALSDIRENVLEWYNFRQNGRLLQVGADFGAMTGLYSKRVEQVVVLDESEEELSVVRKRYEGVSNIRYCERNITDYQKEFPAGFDYVVMVGSLIPPYEETVQSAKKLLKPDGKLIVAVCNQYGIKYWAGAAKDEHSFSREQITRLMMPEDETAGYLEWYYPMPDYRLSTMVYSQTYLPRKGDLTNTITAYDYPKYMFLDVGAVFDTVCEDDRFEYFANSFLMIWSNYAEN